MRQELMVVSDKKQLALLVDPLKNQILRGMSAPHTTAELARNLGLPRQKLGYHVKQLEDAGLLVAMGEDRRGNCLTRQLQSMAANFIGICAEPDALTAAGCCARDRLALECARAIGGMNMSSAGESDLPPAIVGESVIAFDNPREQQAFVQELSEMLAALIDRYGSNSVGASRVRAFFASYPIESD